MQDLFAQSERFLEFDERIVPINILEEHREMFSDVKSWLWLVRTVSDNSLTLMAENKWYHERMENGEFYPPIEKYALVRVRPNASEGWVISGDMYHANPDMYEVLDSFVVVTEKYGEPYIKTISQQEYQKNFRHYDVIDVGFVVMFPARTDHL